MRVVNPSLGFSRVRWTRSLSTQRSDKYSRYFLSLCSINQNLVIFDYIRLFLPAIACLCNSFPSFTECTEPLPGSTPYIFCLNLTSQASSVSHCLDIRPEQVDEGQIVDYHNRSVFGIWRATSTSLPFSGTGSKSLIYAVYSSFRYSYKGQSRGIQKRGEGAGMIM